MAPLKLDLLDKILDSLPINGAITVGKYETDNEKIEHEKALYVLKSYGYVYIKESTAGIFAQGLTDTGVIFISQGGFKEKSDREDVMTSDQKLQRENWQTTTATSKQAISISRWSIIIAVVAILISLWPFILTYLVKK